LNTSLSGVRHAHAMLIGRRINLRRLSQTPVPPGAPIRIEVADGGSAWVFRFGVVVFFDVTSPAARTGFVDRLDELITDRVADGEFEALEFIVVPGAPELLRESALQLDSDDLSSLQVVADVLAKSVVLDHHERLVASTFDRDEPLAEGLSTGRHRIRRLHGLAAHIGEMPLVQHRMVGRAEVGEKPDLLWDRPDLERLIRSPRAGVRDQGTSRGTGMQAQSHQYHRADPGRTGPGAADAACGVVHRDFDRG
jgi:uncharacterized Rmd1/YagE family protein